MAQPPADPSILHFDMFKFREMIPHVSRTDCSQLFLEFVIQELLSRSPHIPLEEFALEFEFSENTRSNIDSLVDLVMGFNPRILWFNFFLDDDLPDAYEFPFSKIMNSSVEVLELNGCDLVIPRSSSLSPQLSSIKGMQLEYFQCRGDGKIEQLLASCVNLETLGIKHGYYLKRFKIELPKLKHFTFHCNEDEGEVSVEICAPSLESLEFFVGSGGKCSITCGTSSLVRAKVDFDTRSWRNFTCWTNVLSFVSGVERLTIQNMWTWFLGEPTAQNSAKEREPKGESHAEKVDVDSEESESQEDKDLEQSDGELKLGAAVMSETFGFRNLKHLELLTGYLSDDVIGLEIVLKKCPQLVTLTLVYKYKSSLDEQLGNEITDRSVDLHLPHLEQVKMKDYRGTKNELYVAGLLKKHGPVLEKIVACPPKINGTSRKPIVL